MRLRKTAHTSRPYMAPIRPFRHLFVYPAMVRQVEREWHADIPSAAWAGAPA
jgi:hypothetical protein